VQTSVIQEIYKDVPTVYDLYTGYNTKQCLKQGFQIPVKHEISFSSKL